MYAQHFSRFLNAAAAQTPELLHAASHSHHAWPDVTRDAQMQAWDDAATLLDDKWENKVFSEVIPEAQKHIAGHLEVSDPTRIIPAPNTHELVARLFSSLQPRLAAGERIRILTTDGEYHSALWQMRRWNELPNIQVQRVPVEPFDEFEGRFKAAIATERPDMVYFSQVMFASGRVFDMENIVEAVQDERTLVVADGYHGFMAKPTSLAKLQDRIFYLAGGYKYAQAGEGACFMVVPTHCPWDPYDIGWFSMFSALGEKINFEDPIEFGNNPKKFWGATFDPSGLYRMNASMRLFANNKMTVPVMDSYVMGLQTYFLEQLRKSPISWLPLKNLLTPEDLTRAGHYLTFRLANAPDIQKALRARNVIVDSRSDILRIGFGIYQDRAMIDRLLSVMRSLSV